MTGALKPAVYLSCQPDMAADDVVTGALKPAVALGILSWQAHLTLRTTLQSLQGILPLFAERVIFFQEFSPTDQSIADSYQLSAIGCHHNIGIMRGMEAIAHTCRSPYILHVENDMRFTSSLRCAHLLLGQALRYMEAGTVRYYSMLSRKNPGETFSHHKYLRYHPAPELSVPDTMARRMRRLLRPQKARRLLGGCLGISEAPEQVAPRWIKALPGGHWSVDSAVFNWSNQAPLYPREWFLSTLLPYAKAHPSSRSVNGFPDLEKEVNCRWWRNQHYPIGTCEGLFTHARLNRPAADEKSG